ncbi:MAG: hypothetical protein WD824_09760 [Cyclobacteriaceae bacterium]
MRGMEVHFGVIRDKPGIFAGLLQSKSLNRQLAVCYSSEGKLIVKISTVMEIFGGPDGGSVILRSQPENPGSETTVKMDRIESIYPIRDFPVN